MNNQKDKPSCTEILANFAAETNFGDLPRNIVHDAKRIILDTIGCGVGGYFMDKGKIVASLARDLGGKPEATIIGDGTRVGVASAAIANGTMGRALDLDDLHEKGTLHSSATIVPVALGTAEYRKNVSGKDFIAAIVLGNDLTCRLALAPRISPAITGISYTYTHGILGGAAVASAPPALRKV